MGEQSTGRDCLVCLVKKAIFKVHCLHLFFVNVMAVANSHIVRKWNIEMSEIENELDTSYIVITIWKDKYMELMISNAQLNDQLTEMPRVKMRFTWLLHVNCLKKSNINNGWKYCTLFFPSLFSSIKSCITERF